MMPTGWLCESHLIRILKNSGTHKRMLSIWTDNSHFPTSWTFFISHSLSLFDSVTFRRYIFLAIYSCEMVIKVIAKGFVLNKYTYLRNPWNWLDFIVITSGYATIGMEVGNLAGLRTFRVLRALKTVSIMPGKHISLNAFISLCSQLLWKANDSKKKKNKKNIQIKWIEATANKLHRFNVQFISIWLMFGCFFLQVWKPSLTPFCIHSNSWQKSWHWRSSVWWSSHFLLYR